MSDTPKTDALLHELCGDPYYKALTESDAEAVVRLARQLERKLAAAQERIRELEENEAERLDGDGRRG